MAILLYCEGTCKKQMGSLEPFIIHENKYMCIKCAPVVFLNPEKLPEIPNIEIWTCDQINAALKEADWECQWTPAQTRSQMYPFSSVSYIWWNKEPNADGRCRIVEVFLDGNWKFFKCQIPSQDWTLETSGDNTTAKPNLEWIIANWTI